MVYNHQDCWLRFSVHFLFSVHIKPKAQTSSDPENPPIEFLSSSKCYRPLTRRPKGSAPVSSFSSFFPSIEEWDLALNNPMCMSARTHARVRCICVAVCVYMFITTRNIFEQTWEINYPHSFTETLYSTTSPPSAVQLNSTTSPGSLLPAVPSTPWLLWNGGLPGGSRPSIVLAFSCKYLVLCCVLDRTSVI